MNQELDELRKKYTREQFVEMQRGKCPSEYWLINKCMGNDCKECWNNALRDMIFIGDSQTSSDKPQIHQEICELLNQTYQAKNKDYGDSFAKLRKEYGNPAILIRLEDKLGRLKRLMLSGEQEVKTESIEDTLKDLANYAIMELVEREIEKEGERLA